MDRATQNAIDKLAKELARTDAKADQALRSKRAPQFGHSSIDSGALEVRDPSTGATRMRIGHLPDGSVGQVVEGGQPPSAPTAPVVAAAPVGLMVSWDGALANDLALPADMDHVSVHVSAASGFTPDAATFVGTIPRAGGVLPVVPLTEGETYYVVLVPVTTGAVEGAPSVEVAGVPDGVGGVPEPGSITETEIADDAISTPKLQALAVTAAKIAAAAIEAGHIKAGAVEASKLAAILVLATRIVAGDPAGGRVEIDGTGLRKYSTAGELQVILEGDDAIFSGTVSGARFTITATGGSMLIDADEIGPYVSMVSAAGPRAQVYASDSHAAVLLEQDPGGTGAQCWLYVDADSAVQQMDSPSGALMRLAAYGTSVAHLVRSPSGASVDLRAEAGSSAVALRPPDSTAGTGEGTSEGVVHGSRRTSGDVPQVSLQGPATAVGANADRRAATVWEGANAARPSTQVTHYGSSHVFAPGLVGASTIEDLDGSVALADRVSLLSPRMRPAVFRYQSGQPGANATNGNYLEGDDPVNFAEAVWQRGTFKTGASGAVRIDITGFVGLLAAAGVLLIGYSLTPSGGGTTLQTRSRSLEYRGSVHGAGIANAVASSTVVIEALGGDTTYTLVPTWLKSSGAWGTDFQMNGANASAIVVTPLP